MILEFEDEKRLLDDATRELMQTCSQAAQKAEGVTLPLSVFIRVVDDDEIRAINREQRGKDASTDVLSFPLLQSLQWLQKPHCHFHSKQHSDLHTC